MTIQWVRDPYTVTQVHSLAGARPKDPADSIPFGHVVTHCGRSIPWEPVELRGHHVGCVPCAKEREGR